MAFWNDLGKAMGNAVSFLGDKSHRSAQLNRIRTVIRCEEKAAEKEYLALGRYYYNNLRDPSNAVTEAHCAQLDVAEERLDTALKLLERFYTESPAEKEGVREEIDLEDVECLEEAPVIPEAPAAPIAPVEETSAAVPAETDENDNLPFEG